MNPINRIPLLLLSLTALVTACGGGGGSSGLTTTAAFAPVDAKTYRQQALGLLKGSYPLSCTEVGKSTAPFAATATIDDLGQLSFTAKGTVNFNVLSSVFSIAANYPQAGVPSSTPPGIAFLGKSGTTSVGMNFDPSDSKGYELAEFFYQEEAINVITSCVPATAQQLQTWDVTKLIDTLTAGIKLTLPCSSGGSMKLTKTGSSLVIDSGSAKGTVNLNAVKLDELLQLPINQSAPATVVEDNLTYTATYLDGSKVVLDLYALGGIKRVDFRNGSDVSIVACS